MGRSIPAWSCPCGFLGTKIEITTHKRRCKIAQQAIKRDNMFKKSLGL